MTRGRRRIRSRSCHVESCQANVTPATLAHATTEGMQIAENSVKIVSITSMSGIILTQKHNKWR